MLFLQYIFFWYLVLCASGSYLKIPKLSFTIGNDNPIQAIAFAILAYIFRPW